MTIVATFGEKLAIYNRLQELLILEDDTDPENKLWKYVLGFNDFKVSEEFPPHINRNHVLNVRREMFGKLSEKPKVIKAKPRVPTKTELADRLEALEQRFERLLDDMEGYTPVDTNWIIQGDAVERKKD